MDRRNTLNMKSIKIYLKGGLGNILKNIPLIKAVINKYSVQLIIQPDLPPVESLQIIKLFGNWAERDNRINIKNTLQTQDMKTIHSPYMKSATSLSGEIVNWSDVKKIGESRLYLNLYSKNAPLNFSGTPLYSNKSYNSLSDKYIISGLCKPLWSIKRYKYWPELQKLLPCYQIYDAKSHTLEDIAAMMRYAKGFIGVDSGLSGLAAAVGCKTFILFGPTDIKKNQPLGDVKLIYRTLPCRPCQNRPGFKLDGCGIFDRVECMEIPAKTIAKKVLEDED